MSWIQFTGEVNEVNLAPAKVGDRISLRADWANELRGRKKELRKSAKALGMRLSWEKDEERFEMGTRPGTEGLWRNSLGHFAYARVTSKEAPLSAHGWDRPRGWNIDYDSTNHGAGTGLDLAFCGEPTDGFRSPSSHSGFGAKMGVRESKEYDRAKTAFEAAVSGDSPWHCVRRCRGKVQWLSRLALADKLGRQLMPDEDAVFHNDQIILTSRGW
jgi:hypothetical protein